MKVTSREAAWNEINKIFPTDYEKDEASSARAGYDIYRHPTLNYYNRICDLGCRLEVLTGEYGENVTNIWIDAEIEEELAEPVGADKAGVKMGNGSSYIIFISDSCERARAIHKPMLNLKSIHPDWYWSISTVQVLRDCRIPELYHGRGYWATIIEHNNGDWKKAPTYEIQCI